MQTLREAFGKIVTWPPWHDLQRQSSVVHELVADLLTVTGDRMQHRQVVLNLPRNGSDAMSGVAIGRPTQCS